MEDLSSSFSRPVVNVRKKPLAWAVKKQIVDFASKHPEVTQGVIAAKFGCNRSTVCKILKKKEKFGAVGVVESIRSGNIDASRSQQLEKLTYEWIVSMRNANIPLTGTIIKETASQIAQRIGKINFMPSNDWLKQLCRCYGIPLTINPAPSVNINNNKSSVPNNNLTPDKFPRHSEEGDEYDDFEDEEDEEEFDEEDEADDVMITADDSYADHCLTDDITGPESDDLVTMMNNNNNMCPDKMAGKMVRFEQVMSAFDTIRAYFEQDGTFMDEDLEVLFDLEQLCITKNKKKSISST